MRRALSVVGELLQLIFISIPLALTIYVAAHVGLLFYLIYKKIK